MPIYEYRCASCTHEFEALVRGGGDPACPECADERVERLLSLPQVHSEVSRGRARTAAKARDRAQGTERTRERIEYEAGHD